MKRGSLRSPIPSEIREELSLDPFMSRCILENDECDGRIEWMHCMTYAGKRVNELYTILPGCHYHHYHEAKYRILIQLALVNRIGHFNALDEFRRKYPKCRLVI